MSLDVYLKAPGGDSPERWAIFIREAGQTREITLEEWNQRFPGECPSLAHVGGDSTIYNANITHNLTGMADAAGIYKALWRPDENGITKAHQLVEPLSAGLEKLRADPDRFSTFNPANGWGRYEGLVAFVEKYLNACRENPDADVTVSR